jgi:hypothetical protein
MEGPRQNQMVQLQKIKTLECYQFQNSSKTFQGINYEIINEPIIVQSTM